MKKTKSLGKSILWLTLYGVSYFLFLLLLAFLFREYKIEEFTRLFPNLDSKMILEMFDAFLNSDQFFKEFTSFLLNHFYYLFFFYLVMSLFLYHVFKKHKPTKKTITRQELIFSGIFAIALSLILNLIIMQFHFENQTFQWQIFLSSGILGPILEELLFRGIIYHTIEKSWTKKQAFWITTSIFALCHSNIFNILYAFAMGTLFQFSYQKYQNIKVPIFLHILTNSIVYVVTSYLYQFSGTYKFFFLIFFFFLLFSSGYSYKKLQENKR